MMKRCPTSSCFDSSSRHRWRAAQVSLESSLVSLAFSRRGAANAFEKTQDRYTYVQCMGVNWAATKVFGFCTSHLVSNVRK